MDLEFAAESFRTVHPGTVTFVGADGADRVEAADHVPDWIKFAPGADGAAVPVVRVVRLRTDRGYSLRSYGADGRLLWVALTVPPAPGPAAAPPARPVAPRPAAADRSAAWDRAPFATGPTGWF